jgi:plasmid maintenance system antidote protein VapI
MSPQFWLGLQADYELDWAKDQSGVQIAREVRVRPEAHGQGANA